MDSRRNRDARDQRLLRITSVIWLVDRFLVLISILANQRSMHGSHHLSLVRFYLSIAATESGAGCDEIRVRAAASALPSFALSTTAPIRRKCQPRTFLIATPDRGGPSCSLFHRHGQGRSDTNLFQLNCTALPS